MTTLDVGIGWRDRLEPNPSRRIWMVLGVTAVVDLLWFPLSNLSIHWAFLATWIAVGGTCLGWWFAGRYVQLQDGPRLLALGLAFMWFGAKALQVLGQLVMTIPVPIADPILAHWDAALGLDWLAYLYWITARPWLADTLAWVYGMMTPLSFGAFLILHFIARHRASEFLALSFIAGLITTVIGAVFPAMGAVTFLEAPQDLMAAFHPRAGAEWNERLTQLRSGAAVDISGMVGLVSFPSYHVALTMIVAWCCRGLPIFPLAVVFALGTAAAAPVLGGHYFVDLIAGTCLAIALIRISQAGNRQRD